MKRSIAVQAFEITDAPRLDPIRVYLQDLGQGHGRITIECYGAAWACYFSSIGSGRTIAEFVREVGPDYLTNAFDSARATRGSTRDRLYLRRIVEAVQAEMQQEGAGGPVTRDAQVREALDLAPSTLRNLIADGRRAGIAPPFAGTERLRRWRGGPDLWIQWVSEVQKWRASKKETERSGCDGEPAPESPAAVSAPTAKPRGSSKPKSKENAPLAATGQERLKAAMQRALTTSPPHTCSTVAAGSQRPRYPGA